MVDSELPLESVREAIAEVVGGDPGRLQASRIPGGASREVWLLESEIGARWVLRRDPPGAQSFLAQEREFRVIETAAAAGVPVPRPYRLEPDGDRFGSPGFLMEWVGGESVPPRLLRRPEYEAARASLPQQLAEALARIHAIDPAPLGDALGPAPADPALDAVALWQAEIDRIGEPLPAVELGLRWLRGRAPPPVDRPTIVHGDFRLGNFIAAEDGLRAVVDWELSHLGDPAEDVGWLCVRSWRFGGDGQRAAGLCSLERFLDSYAAAGGARFEPDRLRWWEVLGNVKWAVICAAQASDHMTGSRRSHELASLGRRICEPEWDLLSLIRERE
jgi:aminoglycoside phosphotransferase (APT) family kinase protein